MKRRALGREGPLVSEIGLGCMGMSWLYGNADRNESITTIRGALDSGITLLDTGDFYGDGHNELLIREALGGFRRDDVFIAVKFDGKIHTSDGASGGSPQGVRTFLESSLRRLGVDYVDLYQPARVNSKVPIEDTVGEIADLVKAGYVRYIGLSEVGADTLRRAHAVHPISWLQTEYSLFNRGIESDILPAARELGIAISAYGVLARGLLSGKWSKERVLDPQDKRPSGPRFKGDNLDKNLALVEALRRIATEHGATVAQLAVVWVLSRGEDVVPLVGARKPSQLTESLGVLDLNLSLSDLVQIEEAVPSELVSGEYYPVPRKTWFV
jgi:aryl-alcohol dehydrogenase-like predicted oxidoreductase